jgi:hypothetical protein
MTTVVEPPSMRDVVLVLLVVAFFGLAALYVRACAALLRSRDEADAEVPA